MERERRTQQPRKVRTHEVRAVPAQVYEPNFHESPSWTTLVANALKRDRRPLNEILGKPSEK